MIIPQFRLSQDSKHIVVVIRIPYVKISNAEFYIEGRIFKFFLHPYLLTIEFKNDLKLSGEPDAASYDHGSYELTTKLLKANENEFFEDLDLITKLLVSQKGKMEKKSDLNKKKGNKMPLIEVIGETESMNEDLEEVEKQIDSLSIGREGFAYGFNQYIKDYFTDLGEEIFELGDFNPDVVPITDRINLRTEIIQGKFDEDAYIYDVFENDCIQEFIAIQPDIISHIITGKDLQNFSEFKDLLKLPNKQYIIKDKNKSLMEIVDILFALFYELRCMSGELSCESANTINHVSSVLSCYVCDQNVRDVLIESYRRALTYSMVRHFDLAQKVKEDVTFILQSGRAAVLRSLLVVKHNFEMNEPRYHLNNLYIEDFCIWVQQLKDEDFFSLSKEISEIAVNKADLKLELEEIEKDCQEMLKEQKEGEDEDDDEEEEDEGQQNKNE